MGGLKSDGESVTQLPTLVDSYARPTEPASAPPPPPHLSPGERIAGRYLVEALLGSGGFGEVYRVLDEIDGHLRALKLHRLGAHHALARESLKGEFAVLAALDHPNIAAVHDFGWIGAEIAFFTQDLVPGARLDGVGLDLRSQRALPVLAQLCRALDYLHSRGILHRDVKPTNILVDSQSDHLTLLDFGIARALATDDERVAGTFGYVAPEAITGGSVDGRADLYAVGVILFQLACGRRPFGGSVDEILHQQLIEPAPILPEGHVNDELRDLIARLLDRDPAQRPASAGELLRLLARALGGEVTLDTRETLSSYVLSAPCIGRAGEIQVLTEHLSSGHTSRPVLLRGEAGTGKSRLLRELRQRLQVAGTSYVGIEAHRAGRGGLVTELARAVLTPAVVRQLPDDDRRELARAIPELRRKRERIAPAVDPERAQRARREALVRGLTIRFAGSRGVIAVEDLHWAADGERAAIAELIAQARGERVPCTFIVTTRPGDAVRPFESLSPLVVSLAELSREQSRELVNATFGEPGLLDGTGVGLAIAEGARSALWIQETLRLAVETGAVARVGSGWRVARDLPALPLAEVLAARLAALERRARRLAETMAIVGAPVRAVDVAEIAPRAKEGFADALGELVRSGIVDDRPLSGQRVYAMHDRFADAALAELSAARRAALHRRVARWLLRRRDWRALGRAARHLSEAGDHRRAARAYAAAADLAQRHARPRDALDLLASQEGALRADGAAVPVALLLRKHDLAVLGGLPDEASRALGALRARAGEADDRTALEIELRAIRATVRDEQDAEARARWDEAIARARALQTRDLEAELLLAAADSDFQRGSIRDGRARCLQAAAIASELSDDALVARAWHKAAYLAVHVGAPEESAKEADRAFRAARRTGDHALQSEIARQKGNALREMNDEPGSMRAYERAVSLARRGGLPELEAMAINNIGILALWMGRFDRARAALERAIELKRRVGGTASIRITLSNMVALLVASGDHEEARALIDEVIPEDAPEGPIIVCTSYANLAETYVAEGDIETAATLYERAYRIGDSRGNQQMAGYPLHGWVRMDAMRGGALVARARSNLPRLAEVAAKFPQEQTRLHVAEAMVADAEGRIGDALEACERAYELRRTARYHWGFVGSRIEIGWLRAVVLSRAGRNAAAERAAKSAKQKLLALTSRNIADPARRERVLTASPVHRAILAGDLDVPPGWGWKPADVRS